MLWSDIVKTGVTFHTDVGARALESLSRSYSLYIGANITVMNPNRMLILHILSVARRLILLDEILLEIENASNHLYQLDAHL